MIGDRYNCLEPVARFVIGDRWFHGSLVHKMCRLMFCRWSVIDIPVWNRVRLNRQSVIWLYYGMVHNMRRNNRSIGDRWSMIGDRWSYDRSYCIRCVESDDWSVIDDRWSMIVRPILLHQMRRIGRLIDNRWLQIGDRWSVDHLAKSNLERVDRNRWSVWSMIGDQLVHNNWSVIGDR